MESPGYFFVGFCWLSLLLAFFRLFCVFLSFDLPSLLGLYPLSRHFLITYTSCDEWTNVTSGHGHLCAYFRRFAGRVARGYVISWLVGRLVGKCE